MVRPGDRLFSIDRNTVASNAGGIKVSASRFLRCYPLIPILSLAALPLAGAVYAVGRMYQFDERFFIAVPLLIIFAIGGCYAAVSQAGLQMSDGDTCPAVVVDPARQLIAVWADMTTSPDRIVPAILVMAAPLRGAGLGDAAAGTRLTTVCLYYGDGKPGHWTELKPIPVPCATGDRAAIERSLAGVPAEQWEALSIGLRKIPQPLQPGLYFL